MVSAIRKLNGAQGIHSYTRAQQYGRGSREGSYAKNLAAIPARNFQSHFNFRTLLPLRDLRRHSVKRKQLGSEPAQRKLRFARFRNSRGGGSPHPGGRDVFPEGPLSAEAEQLFGQLRAKSLTSRCASIQSLSRWIDFFRNFR